MDDRKLTPQEQADNMLKGIRYTYRVVAKQHIHPWYSWALMSAAIGFTVGVVYVANQQVKFDSSQAAIRRSVEVPVAGSGQPSVPAEPSFEIVAPASRASFNTNPTFVVSSPFGLMPASDIKWTVTPVDPTGRTLGDPVNLMGNYRQSIYIPGYFVFVATNFEDLPKGMYEVSVERAGTSPGKKQKKIILNKRLNAPTAPDPRDTCSCISMKVIPLLTSTDFGKVPDYSTIPASALLGKNSAEKMTGSKFVSAPFKVEAAIKGNARKCAESQFVQATTVMSDNSGRSETTVPVSLSANDGAVSIPAGKSEDAEAKGYKPAPYDESTTGLTSTGHYVADDYTAQNSAKFHGKDKITWYDLPGIAVPSGVNVVVKYRFTHNVENCKCNTKIKISGTSKGTTDAEIDSDCD